MIDSFCLIKGNDGTFGVQFVLCAWDHTHSVTLQEQEQILKCLSLKNKNLPLALPHSYQNDIAQRHIMIKHQAKHHVSWLFAADG